MAPERRVQVPSGSKKGCDNNRHKDCRKESHLQNFVDRRRPEAAEGYHLTSMYMCDFRS
jgi:hypothetical protein